MRKLLLMSLLLCTGCFQQPDEVRRFWEGGPETDNIFNWIGLAQFLPKKEFVYVPPEFPDPGERGLPCLERTDYVFRSEDYVEPSPGVPFLVTPDVDILLGPDNPSVIAYARHEHDTGERINFGWLHPDIYYFQSFNDMGARTFGAQLIPWAGDDEYAIGGNHYPTYETDQIYKLSARVPDTDVPFQFNILRSCTPIGEEKDFTPDLTQQTSKNGMDHEWQTYRHLNIHFVIIHGEDHTPAWNDLQIARAYLSAAYAQSTVKILLHYTYDIVNDATLLDTTDWGSDDVETVGGFPRLFYETADVQREDALNVFLVRATPEDAAGVMPIPGNQMVAAPFVGEKMVGPLVYLRSFGYTPGSEELPGDQTLGRMGKTISHEIGHALGLYHPTHYSDNFDPLIETPECHEPYLSADKCNGDGFTDSGARNMMFTRSSLGGYSQVREFTGEQGYVMRMNPLAYIQ